MLPLAWRGSEVAAHYSQANSSPSKVEIVGNRSQCAPPTVFREHNSFVNCIAYSTDGKRIVSGSWDNSVIVWDAESGEVIAGPFKGHTHWINSVGFSRDGKYVASGSLDKTVIIWNAENGEVFRGPFLHVGAVNCVSFSPDGKHIVSGSSVTTFSFDGESFDSGSIVVWDVESGKAIFERDLGGVYAVAYSPDGSETHYTIYHQSIPEA